MLNYATFWQRLLALIIDQLVLLPVWWLYNVLAGQSRPAGYLLEVPSEAMLIGYFIWFHATFGWTLGKRAMGLRVVRRDGEPIGWREAIWRNVIDVGFGTLSVIAAFMALGAISDAEYEANASWLLGNRAIDDYEPEWIWTMTWIWLGWAVAECSVALFSRERRALHDFIAGTVVVRAEDGRLAAG